MNEDIFEKYLLWMMNMKQGWTVFYENNDSKNQLFCRPCTEKMLMYSILKCAAAVLPHFCMFKVAHFKVCDQIRNGSLDSS